MDTKALRQKILDLAIRGKLVSQDPNDEPASVLLERIRAKKKQMVKEGKLKAKDIKNDTVIFVGEDNLHYEKFQDGTVKCIEDEIPFEIPKGWEWERFGNYTINRDSERKPVSLSNRAKQEKIYDYYGASGVIDKMDSYIFSEKLLLIGEDGANLLTRTKPIAFLVYGQYWVNNHAHCIDMFCKELLDFLCGYINSVNLEKYVTGSAQPKLNQDNLNRILVPVPPVSEQRIIIITIEKYNNLIQRIDSSVADTMRVIEQAKSKILDLAIRGKLVPQDPNDEPASVLLERIRQEKKELIKQGKIKRDKKESVIFKGEDNSYYEKIGKQITCIDDEIPFEIPESWAWCRMKQLMYLISGVTYNKRDIQKEGVRILRGGNLTNNNNIKLYDDDIFLPELYIDSQNQIQVGDIIIVASTGSTTVIGKPAFVESYYPKTQIGGFLKIVRSINKQAQQVLWLLFRSNYYHESILDRVGGVNINNIKSVYLEDMLTPVPPRHELTLIVEKYLQFSLLSNIEESLN